MGFLFYAIITNQSIGKLFIAGVIPGILLTLAFMATIYIQCRAHPLFGPAGEKTPWKERFVSTKSGGPIVTLFLLVIGGIYIGIFTPTEGGGIGAAGALILGLIMGRFTWRRFYESLLESGKNMAFLLLILVGATIFTRFIAWCNLTPVIQHAILSWSIPPPLVMVIILAIFFALGPITDTLPLVLIGVPIFHPIGVAMGYDPVWLAVEIVAMIQLGQITPPVAEVLFVLKSVGKDIPLSTIFKGVWPFVWATIAVIILMLIFPTLATWLPNLMYPSPS